MAAWTATVRQPAPGEAAPEAQGEAALEQGCDNSPKHLRKPERNARRLVLRTRTENPPPRLRLVGGVATVRVTVSRLFREAK